MIITFALVMALIIAGLFVVLACGIRTADRRKSPCDRPHNTAEFLARSVLLYARADRPRTPTPRPTPTEQEVGR
jgi:hypothetical protein